MKPMLKRFQMLGWRLTVVLSLAAVIAIAPALCQPHSHLAYAGTTMQQEDTKPVSRYAFERVQGEAAEPTEDMDGPAEIKSVRELREKITAPIYPKTAGQGASDNSGQLDNSVKEYERQARQRVKQTVQHLSNNSSN